MTIEEEQANEIKRLKTERNVLRAELAAVTAEGDRMREALLFAEMMASEMGVDPREKCQRIYDDLHAARAALEGVTEKSGAGNE